MKKVKQVYKAFLELPNGSFTSMEGLFKIVTKGVNDVIMENIQKIFLLDEEEIKGDEADE